jgi:hypothetical protein
MDRLFDVTKVSTSRVIKCLPTDTDVRLRSDGAPVSLTMQLYILRRRDHLRTSHIGHTTLRHDVRVTTHALVASL